MFLLRSNLPSQNQGNSALAKSAWRASRVVGMSLGFLLCSCCSLLAQDTKFSNEQLEFFESKIRPLLVEHCYECHSAKSEFAEASLLLDSREGLLKGGDSGPAIDLQSPGESLFLSAIQYGDLFQMPPSSKLPQESIDLFAKWLELGAPWPAEKRNSAAATEAFNLAKRRSEHWCWQAPQAVVVPMVSDPAWSKNGIDLFIFDRLKQQGLTPNPPASRDVLIRRAYFDLIGLPPTPEQVDAFVKDPDENAFEKVVDELLASPHFGERWARHWMDLVRYAETYGHEFDYPIKSAYKYRDYLIRAFNADVPYDQFVKEHLAGDLMSQPRRHPADSRNESILGTGFWFLGEAVQAPVDSKGDEAARIDNQIDVFTKTFLGLTVACARCHDHKFDAISIEDYYALSGFLQSSRRQEVLLDPHHAIAEKTAEIKSLVNQSDQLAESVVQTFRKQDPESLAQLLQATVEGIAASSPPKETRDPTAQPDESGTEPVSLADTSPQTKNDDSDTDLILEKIARQHGVDAGKLQQSVAALRNDVPVSHPLFVLQQLGLELGKSEISFKVASERLRNRIDERQAQADSTRSKAVQFAKFNQENYRDWYETGFAYGGVWSDVGLAETASTDLLTSFDCAHSGRLGKRQYGVLRSRTFTIEHSKVHYRMLAEKIHIRLIIDGFEMDVHQPLLFEGMSFVHDSQGKFEWRTQSGDLKNYLGHRAHFEIIDHGDGFAAVDEIWFSNDETPVDYPNRLAGEILNGAKSLEEFSRQFAAAVIAQDDSNFGEQVQLINWSAEHKLDIAGSSQDVQHLIDVKKKIHALQADLSEPPTAIGITDGSSENEYLFIRGNHRNRGPEVQRDLIMALRGDVDSPAFDRSQGSGRMYLAEQIVDSANPLTARVMINRIWHHLLGRGLVTTVDNFGVLGEPPTHPELLDWLALDYISSGWSTKAMIKRIMTSQTYRMSSFINAVNEELDPTNRLYHRFPVKRLQGEAIRDAVLSISGDLDPTLFGPSVPVHLTTFMQGRGRPADSGPLNGLGRRSIYTEVRRNFLSPMMLAFDTPIPFNTIGRRSESNVPAQALILMNNPFVADQAGKWAARLIKAQSDPRERVKLAYQQAFSRDPSAEEIDQGLEFLSLQAKEQQLDPNETAKQEKLWADYCHVLMNVKEFIYLK